MPSKAPDRQRPWLPKQGEHKPQEGRKERTKLYDSTDWRKARIHQLRKEPLCRICQDLGKVTLATVCDHIIPFRVHGDFFDSSNYQSLCKTCHDRKSAKERHQAKKVI